VPRDEVVRGRGGLACIEALSRGSRGEVRPARVMVDRFQIGLSCFDRIRRGSTVDTRDCERGGPDPGEPVEEGHDADDK
jgi:hypothetical protein